MENEFIDKMIKKSEKEIRFRSKTITEPSKISYSDYTKDDKTDDGSTTVHLQNQYIQEVQFPSQSPIIVQDQVSTQQSAKEAENSKSKNISTGSRSKIDVMNDT